MYFPSDGAACLDRMMNSCSQIEELEVQCDSEGEQLHCACVSITVKCTQCWDPVHCPSQCMDSLLSYRCPIGNGMSCCLFEGACMTCNWMHAVSDNE